jgi:hypothetical protein
MTMLPALASLSGTSVELPNMSLSTPSCVVSRETIAYRSPEVNNFLYVAALILSTWYTQYHNAF